MKFLQSHLHLFDVAVDNPDVVNLSKSDINATLFRRSFDPYKFAGFDHNGLAILTKVPIADTDAHEIHISTNISLLLVQLGFPGPPFLSTLCTFLKLYAADEDEVNLHKAHLAHPSLTSYPMSTAEVNTRGGKVLSCLSFSSQWIPCFFSDGISSIF